MPADKKKWLLPILTPVGKTVDKLWRIEKKLMSNFRKTRAADWRFGLNLGSVDEVSRRAETARQIASRADKRKRGLIPEHG